MLTCKAVTAQVAFAVDAVTAAAGNMLKHMESFRQTDAERGRPTFGGPTRRCVLVSLQSGYN